MSSDTTHDNAGLMDRRTLMKKTGKLGVAAAVIGGSAVALAAPAAAKNGKSIVLDVQADFNTFSQVDDGGGGGPFYVAGAILAPNSGAFHCWGWIPAGGDALVSQEFDIDGRGKILVAGVESNALRAVSGGTGDFSNARGQGIPEVPDGFGDTEDTFRITFNLTSASGAPIT